jgi:hypothetical protein
LNYDRKNIILTGIFCFVFTFLFSGEKHIKYGMGKKNYELNSHKSTLHSGKYIYGGFYYEFGNNFLKIVQFKVSNSNREIELDIAYVSAATAGNIYYDFAFKSLSFKKMTNYLGFHIGNDINLNFFPKIDNKNLLWFNQTFTGISFISKYKFNSTSRINFNTHIPILSSITYNRFDRLNGKVPNNRSVRTYSGFVDKLFNADTEIGYIFSKYGLNWGVYYQFEINRMSETVSSRLTSRANSVSLRVIY